MGSELPFSDVQILALEWEDGRLVLLRDDDHMLRRFGQVELRTFEDTCITPFVQRAVADEIWVPVNGKTGLHLIDRRGASPDKDRYLHIVLDAAEPCALLIPFGVAYAIENELDATLMRLSTHADGKHLEDDTIPFDTLSHLVVEA
ncbi:MAG: hypothetical protein JXB38_15355 [Anaerolineales bacterium]|nr:hypothetical protein [Anaerolineales bacterium]